MTEEDHLNALFRTEGRNTNKNEPETGESKQKDDQKGTE